MLWTRLLTIIPKPLHIAGLILNQTKMMTTTMLWCSAHQPTQEQVKQLEEKEE
jgi:hypothetical protein